MDSESIRSRSLCPNSPLENGTCVLGVEQSWNFDNSADYTFPTNYIEVNSGAASLKVVDVNHSTSDFSSGTHVGTYINSNNRLSISDKYSSALNVKNIFPDYVSNLVGYWRLDNDLTDSSPSNLTTVSSTGSSFSTDSKIGTHSHAYSSNPTGVRASGFPNLTNQLSISFWINVTSHNSSRRVFSKGLDDANVDFQFLSNSSGLFTFNSTSCSTPYNQEVVLGVWTHFVIVLDGANLKVFKDSVKTHEQSCSASISNKGDNFVIGSNQSGFSSLDGKTDEVALWNRGLSEAEVRKLYENQAQNFSELMSTWTPKFSNLIGYWKMNGNWLDSSLNGNHATPSGSPLFSTAQKLGTHSSIFDGINDTATANASSTYLASSNQPLSLMAWIKPTSIGTGNVVNRVINLHRDTTAGTTVALALGSNNRIQYYNHADTSATSFDSLAILNKWQHIALVYNGTCFQPYLNGVKDGVCSTKSLSAGGSYELTIGSYNGSSNQYAGELDDVAVFNTNLDEAEINLIYNRQKQKSAAHYDSPIIDLGADTNIPFLETITPLPFMKEIVGPVSENSTSYSSLVADLSTGLVGNWHFNETSFGTAPGATDFADSSSYGNHGVGVNTPVLSTNSVLGGAVELQDTDMDTINFGSSASLDFASDFTISTWVYLESYPTAAQDYLISKGNYSSAGWAVGIIGTTSSCAGLDGAIYFSDGDGGFHACTNTAIPLNKWSHILVRYESGTVNIYLNGVLVGQESSITVQFDSSYDVILGKRSPNDYHYNGLVDELAIWNRALSNSEVLHLYQRVANRIKYQVRSCNDANCDSEVFIGPDGTSKTYFSEYHNNSVIDASGNPIGSVVANSARFTFTDFVTAPASNRYFQYRLYLESDDESGLCAGKLCMPEITSLNLSSSNIYYGDSPSIVTNTPLSYSKIESISITEIGTCQIGYQISNNGTDFYFWNSSTWTPVSSSADRSNLSVLAEKISLFPTQVGAGNLYIKAYLTSDTTQSCSIDKISVKTIN
ncbi:LamG domain-containing protein [Halobacteriovorax sp. HLS]|uniref:LamG domain-containing protein n=1 Tax=Halobacteriovorax sp. HLS TaxID=2234000 RepID=UPI001F4E2BF3|nr:LamG domain-containing protein [Halobacteriovorax sp. HLS]